MSHQTKNALPTLVDIPKNGLPIKGWGARMCSELAALPSGKALHREPLTHSEYSALQFAAKKNGFKLRTKRDQEGMRIWLEQL